MIDLTQTVVAVGTPQGRGGIGCVKISGPDAHRIARRLFAPATPDRLEPGTAPRYGRLLAADREAVDQGLAVLFPSKRSSTGEPVAELWAHGSPVVLRALVDAALAEGARPAGPGEFTYRALRHGRLDLSRAEAIRDLVDARTLWQARVALAQAEGSLARRVAPLTEALTDLLARGEAAVEFADEAEVHLEKGGFAAGIAVALALADDLHAASLAGRVLRDGAIVALVGAPNVGKSSLFNRLLDRDRAIVADAPGTTRDTLEAAFDLGGIPVTLVDTAGMRDVDDPVEDEGVRRARAASAEARLVIFVLDGSRPLEPSESERLGRADASTMLVVNKSDLPRRAVLTPGEPLHVVSARTGDGIDALRSALLERLLGEDAGEDPWMTDARHAKALDDARRALARATAAARDGFSEELVLEDLREALRHVGEITGDVGAEEIYDRIFSTFCIGK